MEKIISMKALIENGEEKVEFITTLYKLRKERKILLEFYLTDNDLIHTKVSDVIDRNKPHVDLREEIKKILDTFMSLSKNPLVDKVIHNSLFSKFIRDELITRTPLDTEGFYFSVDSIGFKDKFYDAFYVEYDRGLKGVEFEFSSGKKQIIILTSKFNPVPEDKIFYFERSR